jgi:hypothetical protein
MSRATDGKTAGPIASGANPTKFSLDGGLYAFDTVGATGSSIDMRRLGPDGSTYVSVLTAIITANSEQLVYLPAGQYEFVYGASGATGIYARVSRIPFE